MVDVIIVATDSGPLSNRRSSSVTITVYVQDANDQRPSFVSDSYSIALPEDTSTDTLLGVNIEAMDGDTGLGGTIVYSIVSSVPILSQESFEINSTNGMFVLF